MTQNIVTDHPNNVNRGDLCAYIRESLPVRCLSSIYLQECLTLEITGNNKKGYVVPLYRSPSQTPDEFDTFINILEKLIIDIYSRKADFLLMLVILMLNYVIGQLIKSSSAAGCTRCQLGNTSTCPYYAF